MICTALAVIISALFVLFNIKKLYDRSIGKNIAKYLIINGVFIILISLFFYVPLFEHKNATEYVAFARENNKSGFLEHRLYPYQLIFGKNQFEWDYKLSENKTNENMSFSIGLPIIVALLLTPVTLNKIEKKYRSLYIFTLCLGFIFALMSTTLFPWEYISLVPVVIQFPWRLLLTSTFAFSIIAGVNIFINIPNISNKNIYIFLLIVMMSSGNFISNVVNFDTEFSIEHLYNDDKLDDDQCAAYEYLPKKAYNNLEYVIQRNSNVIIIEGNADILNEQKDGSKMSFIISNNNGVSLELPFIYYLGYEIKLNEKNIDYKESENGFIEIYIPESENGKLDVVYRGTLFEKTSVIISIIGVLAFLAYIGFFNKKKK